MKRIIHVDHDKVEAAIDAVVCQGKEVTLKELEKMTGYKYHILYANGYDKYVNSHRPHFRKERERLMKSRTKRLLSVEPKPAIEDEKPLIPAEPKSEHKTKPLSEEEKKGYAQVWHWKMEHQELILNLEHSGLTIEELEDAKESIEFMARHAIRNLDRIIAKVNENNQPKD